MIIDDSSITPILSSDDVIASVANVPHDELQVMVDTLNTTMSAEHDDSGLHSIATSGDDGFMSTSDKIKLDGIEDVFASGTKIPFFQASAPTGWTQDTTHNDKALRVVSGSGGGSGGTYGLSSASVPGTSLSEAQLASHRHEFTAPSHWGSGPLAAGARWCAENTNAGNATGYFSYTGSGNTHNHALALKYIDVIICTKD